MYKCNIKSLNDTPLILGFNKIESTILMENGISTKEQLDYNIPDHFNKVQAKPREWLQQTCYLKGVEEFDSILNQFVGEKICIIGDYDCDGILGTVIFRLGLERLGFETFHIIPDRILDGYAVKKQHIDFAIENGASLIVTVDNGTSANEAIAYAKEQGLTVIVTDHHIAEGELPNADLIINPHVNHDDFEDICGAAVAAKIISYLFKNNGVEERRLYDTILNLSTIATICDMMPLRNENRIRVKLGLECINKIKDNQINCITSKLLAGMADTNYMHIYNSDKNITEETLAYYIGPVLNATGRVEGDVNQMVEDILASDNENFNLRGYKEKNKLRKIRTREIAAKHTPNNNSVDITLLKEDEFNYPVDGLVGLLASRIANQEHKPCFVGAISKYYDTCKLSGRAINDYPIFEAYQRIKDAHPELELDGGGHEGAVGVQMPLKSLREFERLICEDYNKYDKAEEIPTVYELNTNELDMASDAHYKMAPFGIGFSKLVFKISGILEGKNQAVNMIVVQGFEFKSYSDLSKLPEVGTYVDVYFSMSFGNKQYTEFKVERIEAMQ